MALRSRFLAAVLLCAAAPLVHSQSARLAAGPTPVSRGPVLERAEAAPAVVLAEGKLVSPDGAPFGADMVRIGDQDGNGVDDLVVGEPLDDDEGPDRGAIWTLFMEADGSIGSTQKISDARGNFIGLSFNTALDDQDRFGTAVAWLGDLDGDGNEDVAVGAPGDDDGGQSKGAVYVMFLRANGRVKDYQKISTQHGGFTGSLQPFDGFGAGLAALGDLNQDGTTDLAVGAPGDVTSFGTVHVLYLQPDGTVLADVPIERFDVAYNGSLFPGNGFGSSITALGDLNGDCIPDFASGSPGGLRSGGVQIVFLRRNGTVKSSVELSAVDDESPLVPFLDDLDEFGASVAAIGDVNASGSVDLAVGAPGDDDGATDAGAVYTLFLNPDGSIADLQKISATAGGLVGGPAGGDRFGSSLAALGLFDEDLLLDLAVGAEGDDTLGTDLGAIHQLYLDGSPLVATATPRNGLGINPTCLSTLVTPEIGTTFEVLVDTSGHPGANLSAVVVYDQPSSGIVRSFGELLVDVTSCRYLVTMQASAGGTDVHQIAIPDDSGLIGLSAEMQAVIFGGAGPEVCNALGLRIGPQVP